jgi:acetyl-CoA acetyltransferase
MSFDHDALWIRQGEQVNLDKRPTLVDAVYRSKKEYKEMLADHVAQLSKLQQVHYADNRYAVLLIFQAMDAAGKDGVIRHVMSGVNLMALYAQAHFHQYGTTAEQLARIAMTCRANAVLNPKAVFRTPMSLDDYMASRMISSPLRMFDCDVHCDASTAIVLSRVDAARSGPNAVCWAFAKTSTCLPTCARPCCTTS